MTGETFWYPFLYAELPGNDIRWTWLSIANIRDADCHNVLSLLHMRYKSADG
jgi:hypothetical protein